MTIKCLQEKDLRWSKENVLSAGKPFVTQLGDILWRLDGHHEKLAANSVQFLASFCSSKDTMCPRELQAETAQFQA